MSYSKTGNRPFEFASKSNHTYIIKDPEVLEFLKQHELPKEGDEISLLNEYIFDIDFNIDDSLEF
ncbi:MAG: hypothetical protein PHI32_14170, partial [Dysgonamonadaceae bacterium]|nr:hypothetical protein [Dysgonamonadaceae bacterium]